MGDIEGAAIPAAYFDYLRRGVTALMRQVLEHNALDVVSMAAVLSELDRRVDTVADGDPAEDCLGLAELSVRAGDPNRAEALSVMAAERARSSPTALDALWLGARLAARRRDWSAVVHRLNTALGLAPLEHDDVARLHLALARVCEHRLKDRRVALVHARASRGAEDATSHGKRLARLDRSLAAHPAQQPMALVIPRAAGGRP